MITEKVILHLNKLNIEELKNLSSSIDFYEEKTNHSSKEYMRASSDHTLGQICLFFSILIFFMLIGLYINDINGVYPNNFHFIFNEDSAPSIYIIATIALFWRWHYVRKKWNKARLNQLEIKSGFKIPYAEKLRASFGEGFYVTFILDSGEEHKTNIVYLKEDVKYLIEMLRLKKSLST